MLTFNVKEKDYKTRIKILGIDRRWLASELGLSYTAFNYRLLGFGPWVGNLESRLVKILCQKEEEIAPQDTIESVPVQQTTTKGLPCRKNKKRVTATV